jgi:hypothetical protein
VNVLSVCEKTIALALRSSRACGAECRLRALDAREIESTSGVVARGAGWRSGCELDGRESDGGPLSARELSTSSRGSSERFVLPPVVGRLARRDMCAKVL